MMTPGTPALARGAARPVDRTFDPQTLAEDLDEVQRLYTRLSWLEMHPNLRQAARW